MAACDWSDFMSGIRGEDRNIKGCRIGFSVVHMRKVVYN